MATFSYTVIADESGMVLAKNFIYAKAFVGMPDAEDVAVVEEELGELKDGEFLAEAVYLSVDPYMRLSAPALEIGQEMGGGQVAKITESKNPKYPVGKHILAYFGWRTHTISNGKQVITILPDETIPLSYYLGVVGMPGITAYFGLFDCCKPKPDETLVVTTAGGAVGSEVCQLAKIHGCKVIGITGSDEKVKWLKELGFDDVINYKTTEDLSSALKIACPNGIDCYFDNVGGEMAATIMSQMNPEGRVCVCGCISHYNDVGEPTKVTPIQKFMIFKRLKMEGFNASAIIAKWPQGIEKLLGYVKEGKLRTRETVTEGFGNMLNALIGVLKGENIGKAIVKV